MNDLYYYSLAATTSKSTQAVLKNISKINASGKLPVVDIKSKGGPDIHKAVKEHNKKVEHKPVEHKTEEHKSPVHKTERKSPVLKKISKVTASGKLPVVDIKSKGGPDIHKAVREHNKAVTHKDNAVKHAKNADTHSKMVEHHVAQANNPDNPPHIQAAHQTAAQANADAGHKQAAAAEANIRAENKKEAADRAKTPFYQMLAKQEFQNHSKAAVNASHQAIAATNTAKNISDTVNSQTPSAAATSIVQPQTVYPAVLLSKGSNSLHPTAVKHPSHLLANHHLKRNIGGGEQWTVPLSTVTHTTKDITASGDSHAHHPHGEGIATESQFITPGADPSLDQVNHVHHPHGLGIDTESSSLPIASDVAYKKNHPTTDDVNDTNITGISLPPVNKQDPTKLMSSPPPAVTNVTSHPGQTTTKPIQTQFLKDALNSGATLSKPIPKTSTSPIFSKINVSGVTQNKTIQTPEFGKPRFTRNPLSAPLNQNGSTQIHDRHPTTHHHFHHQIGVPNMIPDNTSRPDVVWNQEIAKFNAQPENVKKMKIATEYNTNLHDVINTAHGLSLQEGHHYTQAELDKRKTKQRAAGMIMGPLNFTKPTQAQIDIGMHQINTVPPPPPGGYLRINPASIAGKLQRGYVPYEHDPDTQQLTDQGMADALGVAGRPSNIFPGKRNTVTPDPDPSTQSPTNNTSVPDDTAEQLAILDNSTGNLSNFAQEIPGLEMLVTGAAFLFLAYMIVENI